MLEVHDDHGKLTTPFILPVRLSSLRGEWLNCFACGEKFFTSLSSLVVRRLGWVPWQVSWKQRLRKSSFTFQLFQLCLSALNDELTSKWWKSNCVLFQPKKQVLLWNPRMVSFGIRCLFSPLLWPKSLPSFLDLTVPVISKLMSLHGERGNFLNEVRLCERFKMYKSISSQDTTP